MASGLNAQKITKAEARIIIIFMAWRMLEPKTKPIRAAIPSKAKLAGSTGPKIGKSMPFPFLAYTLSP
jgi:hypothetical protein